MGEYSESVQAQNPTNCRPSATGGIATGMNKFPPHRRPHKVTRFPLQTLSRTFYVTQLCAVPATSPTKSPPSPPPPRRPVPPPSLPTSVCRRRRRQPRMAPTQHWRRTRTLILCTWPRRTRTISARRWNVCAPASRSSARRRSRSTQHRRGCSRPRPGRRASS